MTAAWRVSIDTTARSPAKCRDHRDDAADFLLRRNRIGAGAGRFPPTSRMSAPASSKAAPWAMALAVIKEVAAVAETVGGDVDDPHDRRPVQGESGERLARPGERVEPAGPAPNPRFRQGPDARSIRPVRLTDDHFHHGESQRTAGQPERRTGLDRRLAVACPRNPSGRMKIAPSRIHVPADKQKPRSDPGLVAGSIPMGAIMLQSLVPGWGSGSRPPESSCCRWSEPTPVVPASAA